MNYKYFKFLLIFEKRNIWWKPLSCPTPVYPLWLLMPYPVSHTTPGSLGITGEESSMSQQCSLRVPCRGSAARKAVLRSGELALLLSCFPTHPGPPSSSFGEPFPKPAVWGGEGGRRGLDSVNSWGPSLLIAGLGKMWLTEWCTEPVPVNDFTILHHYPHH